MALRIPASTGRYRFFNRNVGEFVTFSPNGPLVIVGDEPQRFSPNPRGSLFNEPTRAARLLVGLYVGEAPKWTDEDLIRAVVSFLDAKKKPPEASFIVQKGTYRSEQTGGLVTEDSRQVVILDFYWPDEATFAADMEELSEYLISVLHQEKIYLDMQVGGVTKYTIETVSDAIVEQRSRAPK